MIIACASHFLIDLPLFGAAPLLLCAAIALIVRKERRRTAAEPEQSSGGSVRGLWREPS